MRVFIAPLYRGQDHADGGIRRLCEAQERYLPEHGIDVLATPDGADLIACHGTMLVEASGVPLVAHNHGLMWHEYNFEAWGDDVNRHAIDLMVRAQAVTAPSRWVAHAITRGMLATPHVIYHGVNAEEWAHDGSHQGYVLWNKARADQVSNPADMNAVAARLPSIQFASTFGQYAKNVHIMGARSYEEMRPIVQHAAVYLATARETFGIGTLEAMAAGVPVAGWRYGGQAEIVIEGETGYLAEWGDYDGLARCVERCIEARERLSKNCIDDVLTRWGWQDKIAQYADLYQRVLADWRQPRPKVSVIVTTHNLARYLPDALASIGAQTMRDWECLIIDDCSTDETASVAMRHIDGWRELDDMRGRYIKTPNNLKLSGARNYGRLHANGKYLIHLDADDMLPPNALDVLSHALDTRSDIHIAYGSLDTIADDGAHQRRNPWPAGAFDWAMQIAHLNQLPYAAMVRREVLERSGGYRLRDWRAEDASLWTRLTSFGFRAAKVTDDATLVYRIRQDSKGSRERQQHADVDGDWTAWYPWRLAGDAESGMEATRQGKRPHAPIVPFGAQGTPRPPRKMWPCRHHQEPVVSIIIPVGPGHQPFLIDALDSVQAQTVPHWECIVVNDSGLEIGLTPWPWARLVYSSGGIIPAYEPRGAGAARNAGLAAARAPLVVFLDADDILCPRALEEMLKAFVASSGRYVYTDWLTLEDEARIDGAMEAHEVEDYDAQAMLSGLRHAVTALIPAEWARAVGGFDETLPVFEDWDFFCKLAASGYCGTRAAIPLLIYRTRAGMRTRTALRERATADDTTPRYTPLGEAAAAAITDRYAPFRTGEMRSMPCGTCGGAPMIAAQHALAELVPEVWSTGEVPLPAQLPVQPQLVRLEFIGEQWGEMTYIGKESGRPYRAGRDPKSRFIDVDPRDVPYLLSLERFSVTPIVQNDAPAVAMALQ
jgi:glycosyltransferase involved in cell wall biosynthesis